MDASKQSYSFNLIMTRSTEQPVEGADSPYTYSARLFNDWLDITDDRLFVTHFPNTPMGEFVASSCELISSLSSKGICVTMYEGNEIKACGTYRPSARMLRSLADPNFNITETFEIPLELKKKVIATVELSLQFSCTDPELDTRMLPFGCYDICRPKDKTINPRDVIFTLGRSGRCAATSCITDERLMTHAGEPLTSIIDKKKRQASGQCACVIKGIKPVPELDPSKEQEMKLLKKLLNELEIDREQVPTPPSGHEHSRRQAKSCKVSSSCSESESFDSSENWPDPPSEDKPMEEINIFDADLTPEQLEELNIARQYTLGVCPVIKAPKLANTKYRPPVLCPVCKANITWLPKVAACPYCGYKRWEMENPSEEPFDETTTAAEVLRNHAIKIRLNEGSETGSKGSKGCNCQSDRVCARCRIQELCHKMLASSSATKVKKPDKEHAKEHAKEQGKEKGKEHGKEQAKEPAKEKKEKKDKSKMEKTPAQHRKELIKIFTEMRDAYTDKSPSKEVAEICKAAARKGKKRHRMSKAGKNALKEVAKIYTGKGRRVRCGQQKIKHRKKSKRYTFLVRKGPLIKSKLHRTCANNNGRVPCHMGWRWTSSEMARHKCWRPGAIKKSIREIMAYFLVDFPGDSIVNSRFHYRPPKKPEPIVEELIQHPTLHIAKKYDEYTITLRPLKDPKSLAVAANPYENMKPLVFRIIKDPIATGKRSIKLALKDRGYPVCICAQPVAKCFCRSHVDRKLVAAEVKLLSEARGWEDICDSFVYSDVSESDSENELEFGVTPPAGVIKPERLCRPDRVNTETQYCEDDWAMTTVFPHPPSALVQYGSCVCGERKHRFNWILGKGNVHKEYRPPKKINRKKKVKKDAKGRQKGGCDDAFTDGPNRAWFKPQPSPAVHANGLQ